MKQEKECLNGLSLLMEKLSLEDRSQLSQILNSPAKWIDDTIRYFFNDEVRSQKLNYICSQINSLRQRVKQFFSSCKEPQCQCQDLQQLIEIDFRVIYEIACKIKKGKKQLTNQQYLKIDNLFNVFCSLMPQDSRFIDLQKFLIKLQLCQCLGSIYILEVESTTGKIFYVGSIRYFNDHIIALAEPFTDIEIMKIKTHAIQLNLFDGIFLIQKEGKEIAWKIQYCAGNKFVKIMTKQLIKSQECTTIPREDLYHVCLSKVILLRLQDKNDQSIPSISLTFEQNHIQLINYFDKSNGLVFVESHSKKLILYGLYRQKISNFSVAFLQQDILKKQPRKNIQEDESQNKALNSEGRVKRGPQMMPVQNQMKYPYNSICKLRIDQKRSGTAFFLRGKCDAGCRFLMTCAHIFIEGNLRHLTRLRDYVLQFPAYQQCAEGQTSECMLKVVKKDQIKNVYVHDLYQHYTRNNDKRLSKQDYISKYQESQFYDIAVIQLYEPFHPNAEPHNSKKQMFGFDLHPEIVLNARQNVQIAGFPDKFQNLMQRSCKNHFKTSKNQINYQTLFMSKFFDNMKYPLYVHHLTTYQGNSGSPCFSVSQDKKTVSLIGVHTTEICYSNFSFCQANLAVNIYNKDIWQWFLNIEGFDQVKGVQKAAEPLKK